MTLLQQLISIKRTCGTASNFKAVGNFGNTNMQNKLWYLSHPCICVQIYFLAARWQQSKDKMRVVYPRLLQIHCPTSCVCSTWRFIFQGAESHYRNTHFSQSYICVCVCFLTPVKIGLNIFPWLFFQIWCTCLIMQLVAVWKESIMNRQVMTYLTIWICASFIIIAGLSLFALASPKSVMCPLITTLMWAAQRCLFLHHTADDPLCCPAQAMYRKKGVCVCVSLSLMSPPSTSCCH